MATSHQGVRAGMAPHARATAGAEPAMEPHDAFWGDRHAMVIARFGHRRSLAASARASQQPERSDLVDTIGVVPAVFPRCLRAWGCCAPGLRFTGPVLLGFVWSAAAMCAPTMSTAPQVW